MTEQAIDHVRGVVIAVGAAVGVDQSMTVVAQSIPAISDTFVMQLAEKGGGWLVLLIVLLFYRRDFLAKNAKDHDTSEKLYQALTKQADSNRDLSVALAENTEVMRRVIAIEEGRR